MTSANINKGMKSIKMIRSAFASLSVWVCMLTNTGYAQSAPREALLALSKRNHTLAIVDASTLKVIATIPVGEDPHEVIASPDGKTAYVSIYGGGSLHTINVIDLTAQKRLKDIDSRPLSGPHGLAFMNNKLWFTVEGSKTIGSYDPLTDSIDWCMGTGQDRTHMIYVTTNAKKIYTTNVASGTVGILQDTLMKMGNMPPPPAGGGGNGMSPPNGAMPQGNAPPPGMRQPRHNWEQTLITVSKGCEGFDVSPDGAELWTASSEDGKIYIINTAAKTVSVTVDARVNGANRLKFTPNGKLVFISSLRSGKLTVYEANTRKPVKQINIGHGAAGIVMQPDGARAFIACTPDNYVAVVDLKTLEIISKIDVGGEPDGLAWAIKQ